MNTGFIYPGDLNIENQFDLAAIAPSQAEELLYSRNDAFLPTLAQLNQYYNENDDEKKETFSSTTMIEQPIYVPLYNHIRHYTPSIKVHRELVIPEWITRKSLRGIDFSAFVDITHQCSYSFSTYKYNNGVEQLLDDDLSLYWQSDSNTAPHFVNVQLPSSLLLAYLCIYIDCTADESYTPNELVIRTGLTPHGYTTSQLIQLTPPPTGWIIVPLQDMKGYLDEIQKLSTKEQINQIITHNNDGDGNNITQPSHGPYIPLLKSPYIENHVYGGNNNNNNDDGFDHYQNNINMHPPFDSTFINTTTTTTTTTTSTTTDGIQPHQQTTPHEQPQHHQHTHRRRQFNNELDPIEVYTSTPFAPNLNNTYSPNDDRSTNDNNDRYTSDFIYSTQPIHSIPRNTTTSTIVNPRTTQSAHITSSQSNSIITKQHRIPSFHMLIEILSSFQLGRDCRLRGLKLYAYNSDSKFG